MKGMKKKSICLTMMGMMVVGASLSVAEAGTAPDHSGHGAAATQAATGGGNDTTTGRKILYYKDPMGLPDTSPTPKKDSMGMDYIPVYENEVPK
ncbi:MAG: hypothetical protein HQL89_14760 [Magnetococcales bacterium]|nr:hypothetical protein [Magnetococcales bacterium]